MFEIQTPQQAPVLETLPQKVTLEDIALGLANDQIITIESMKISSQVGINMNPEEEFAKFMERHAGHLNSLNPEELKKVEEIYNTRMDGAEALTHINFRIFPVFPYKPLPQAA